MTNSILVPIIKTDNLERVLTHSISTKLSQTKCNIKSELKTILFNQSNSNRQFQEIESSIDQLNNEDFIDLDKVLPGAQLHLLQFQSTLQPNDVEGFFYSLEFDNAVSYNPVVYNSIDDCIAAMPAIDESGATHIHILNIN